MAYKGALQPNVVPVFVPEPVLFMKYSAGMCDHLRNRFSGADNIIRMDVVINV